MSGKDLIYRVKTYREIQLYIEELQAEAEGIKDEITAEMAARETEEMIVDVFKVRYKTVVSKRLDSKRLQQDHGELCGQYMKESAGKRFSIA